MSSKEMSKWCFLEKDVWSLNMLADEEALSEEEETEKDEKNKMEEEDDDDDGDKKRSLTNGPKSPKDWQMYKKNILNWNESRNGRETQRFAKNTQTGQLLRLTTGCVPIMNDGKILLVSSSRKGEWILPKGGWELDETMQVSALRETYEEGGILGVIGPRLSAIDFETRKGKKRRLELELVKKKCEIAYGSIVQQQQQQQHGVTSSTVSVQSNNTFSNYSHYENDQALSSPETTVESQTTTTASSSSPTGTNKDCLATQIRNELHSTGNNTERHDHLVSTVSAVSSSCTHVKLSMFPLYVIEVRENWPESGRARKVVDIDTAIDTMSSRPEFQQVLIEVKQKGYHLNIHGQHSGCGNINVRTISGDEEVEIILTNDSII